MTPEPTRVPDISVLLPKSLSWLQPVLNDCAETNRISFILNASTDDLNSIKFQLSSEQPSDPIVYSLISGSVIPVTTRNAGLTFVTMDGFKAAIEGKSSDLLIGLYPGDFVQTLQSALSVRVSDKAVLIPDEASMIEYLTENPAAIGFLPEFMTTEVIVPLEVQGRLVSILPVSLTAETKNQPTPQLQNWLVCVKNSLEP